MVLGQVLGRWPQGVGEQSLGTGLLQRTASLASAAIHCLVLPAQQPTVMPRGQCLSPGWDMWRAYSAHMASESSLSQNFLGTRLHTSPT